MAAPTIAAWRANSGMPVPGIAKVVMMSAIAITIVDGSRASAAVARSR